LAVLSGDRVACYTSDTGTPLYPLDLRPSDRESLVAVRFITKDRMIAVTSDRALTTWTSHPTWHLERTIGAADSTTALIDRVTALDFSPDGTLLATGSGVPSRSGELKLWNIETGELVRTIADAHSDTVLGVAFSPDGNSLATCGADRMMKVFETESGRAVKSFEGHAHHVLGVSWRADGRMLATSGADCAVKVWDFETGKAIRTIEGFQKEVTAIEFLGLSDQFVLSTGDPRVVIRTTAGGSGPTFAGATDFMFNVRTSEDGRTIAAGGQDSVLRVWDHQGGSLATFAPTTTPQAE
jgi:WD40 repeat protein